MSTGKGQGEKRKVDSSEPEQDTEVFMEETDHRNTQLRSGRRAVMLDTGSCGNLAGSKWCINTTKTAMSAGREVKSFPRQKPLGVSGVGKGAEVCKHDCHMPCCLKTGADSVLRATYKAPIVPESDLPALLGLETLKRLRGVYDAHTNQLHLLGAAGLNCEALPPGTTTIQCEYAPSGHVMIPIDHYEEGKQDLGGIEYSPVQMNISSNNTDPAQE